MQSSTAELDRIAPGLSSLRQRPVIDTIDAQRLTLIASQVAPGCNRAEVGYFLELCAKYDLDPFAHEAWCAKGSGDRARLLVMVGRDGLRKIASRNGLVVDSDIVRARDTFKVTRKPDRSREILHSYEHADGDVEQSRGPIVGAWAEVYAKATGEQLGYFFAPVGEYRPKDPRKLQYSPWGAQESVMIQTAAERQAIRQATPLGGLVGEGEDARLYDFEVVTEPEPEDAQVVGEDRVPDAEVAELLAAINAAGWTEDQTRMQLVAIGLNDVEDIPAALGSLCRGEVLALVQALQGAEVAA